jgi:hypothetical protein
MDSSDLTLKNISVYKENMDISLKDIYSCLKLLIEQYIKCCLESNTIDKYYVDKGINIIINVFKLILLYTKNLEITKMYSINSIYYYIEYINQISNKESEIVFVNLTVNDAILYVYRKSIYEISDSYKKKFALSTVDKIKFKTIGYLVLSYQSMYSSYINTVVNVNKLSPSYFIKINSFYESLFDKKMLDYNNNESLKKLNNNHSNIFENNDNKIDIDNIISKMNTIVK